MQLPCVNKGEFELFDLEQAILDEKINDLIFGKVVSTNNNEIQYVRDGKQICDTIHGLKSTVKRNESRCRLELKSAASGKKTLYLRFRYSAAYAPDALRSKGWSFAKKGYLFDLRVADIRETLELRENDSSKNMTDIDEVNAFLIHPQQYLITSESPNAYYKRILEPGVWRQYLESCGEFKSTKYVINQWRGEKVSHKSPFRMFAHLHHEFGGSILLVYLLGVATVPFAMFLLSQFWGGATP